MKVMKGIVEYTAAPIHLVVEQNSFCPYDSAAYKTALDPALCYFTADLLSCTENCITA